MQNIYICQTSKLDKQLLTSSLVSISASNYGMTIMPGMMLCCKCHEVNTHSIIILITYIDYRSKMDKQLSIQSPLCFPSFKTIYKTMHSIEAETKYFHYSFTYNPYAPHISKAYIGDVLHICVSYIKLASSM